MRMVLVKSTSIHIMQAVANSVFLDKVLMWCHTLLLPARIYSVVPHRTFTTKFVAVF